VTPEAWVALFGIIVVGIIGIIGGILKLNTNISKITVDMKHLCRSNKTIHSDMKTLSSKLTSHLLDSHVYHSKMPELEMRIKNLEDSRKG